MPSGNYDRQKYKNPPKTQSGYKGVVFYPWLVAKPYKAYIRKKGQYLGLGYYATKEEAADAYDAAALKIYGPDAYLNCRTPVKEVEPEAKREESATEVYRQNPKELLNYALTLLRKSPR